MFRLCLSMFIYVSSMFFRTVNRSCIKNVPVASMFRLCFSSKFASMFIYVYLCFSLRIDVYLCFSTKDLCLSMFIYVFEVGLEPSR